MTRALDNQSNKYWISPAGTAIVLLALLIGFGKARGQTENAIDSASPTEGQMVRDIILCQGPTWLSVLGFNDESLSAPQQKAYLQSYNALMKKWEIAQRNLGNLATKDPGFLPVTTHISGVSFTHLMPMAERGFLGSISYSPSARIHDMRTLLQTVDAPLQGPTQKRMGNNLITEWQATRSNGRHTTVYRVIEGNVQFIERPKGGADERKGMSLVCSVRASTAQEEQAQGVIGTEQVANARANGSAGTPEWFNELIKHGTPEAKLMLARSPDVLPWQVQKLLDLRQAPITTTLIENPSVDLTANQIDQLIHTPMDGFALGLIKKYHSRLSPTQRDHLSQAPRWKSALLLLDGGSVAVQELLRLYRAGNRPEINAGLALLQLYQFSPDKLPLIDIILEQGSLEDRRMLSSYAGIMYTPTQIQSLLSDKDTAVVNGVLRREDLKIDSELIKKGLTEQNPHTLFWYTRRPEAQADSAQLERMLTHGHGPTRAGAVWDTRNLLTSVQMARALSDPFEAVVSGALRRHDLVMSEQQLDDCIRLPAAGLRFACARRPDFIASYGRWLTMLTDWNANTWSTHITAHPETLAHMDEYLQKALATADTKQLLTIANHRDMKWTAAQLTWTSEHPDAQVRKAFCTRATPANRADCH